MLLRAVEALMTQPQVRLPELPLELQRLIFAHMYATRIQACARGMSARIDARMPMLIPDEHVYAYNVSHDMYATLANFLLMRI